MIMARIEMLKGEKTEISRSKTILYIFVLLALFVLAFVGIFVIQDYFEEGRPDRDFVLSMGVEAAFVLYFVWFYARTKKLYTNWGRFFGLSLLKERISTSQILATNDQRPATN